MSNKEYTLAMFPLNVCLLPGEDIPLRIFEPRYKQLIEDCEKDGIHFGIPYKSKNQMLSYGTQVNLKQIVAKNSKGEMVITVEGVTNFEILSYKDPRSGKLYAEGKVKEMMNNREVEDPNLVSQIIMYSEKFDSEFLKNVEGNIITLNDIAIALNLSSDDKYKYISLKSADEKEKFLRAQMSILFKLREQEKLLKNDYYLN